MGGGGGSEGEGGGDLSLSGLSLTLQFEPNWLGSSLAGLSLTGLRTIGA